MASKAVAESDFASDQLVARTDGRTNGRPNHLLDIPHVPERAGEISNQIVPELAEGVA